MMGSTSSAAEAAKTEATNQPKKTGPKREKSRTQKDAHNAHCRNSRLKLKRERSELEKLETEYCKKMRAENERMKKELEEKNFKLQCLENSKQELKRALEKKAGNEERMRQILATLNFNSVEWFASQGNMQVGQVSGTRVLQDFNELQELGTTGTDTFLPSHADFYQQFGLGGYIPNPAFDQIAWHSVNRLNMFAGPDNTNITASAAGPSSVANHALPCVLDAPTNDGVLNDSAVGSSFDADLTVFGVPNNHDNLFTHNPATGFTTPSAAAGFSFAENLDMPTVFDASNNLFTAHHNPDAGYKLSSLYYNTLSTPYSTCGNLKRLLKQEMTNIEKPKLLEEPVVANNDVEDCSGKTFDMADFFEDVDGNIENLIGGGVIDLAD